MNRKIVADLHNHTTASDGDFSPAELVCRAKAIGIKAVGITDHDTLTGLKSAVQAGKEQGMEIIPGVEVSVRFKRSYFTGTLHLLCYFPITQVFDDRFVDTFHQVLSSGRGETLVQARVHEINAVFGPKGQTPVLPRELAVEDVSRLSRNVTRRHFALALKNALGVRDENAITDIIGNASPAYLPSGIDLEAAKTLIEQKEILAVLAHPAAGSFPGKGHYKEVLPHLETVERILPEFIAAGIRGIEVYYPGHIKAHENLMKSWAEKYHLLITGGSDCHDGKERPVGVAGLSESEFNLFKAGLR